ncbi:MAG: pyridoxine 5'-phosphate synthase [Gammaproteobacteria bacterium]|nr:MAG: pyridoxine 5'-phosphate synthase [Gammaproteobacteria bacterium]
MTASPPLLGVNVDHAATLRQARRTPYPDPVEIARLAEDAGADYITAHLREDRRHIQDHDIERLLAELRTHLNLEMAVTEEMLRLAERWRPAEVCLVPEKRAELTTEGGLDVAGQTSRIAEAVARLAAAGCRVSLFIDPEPRQVDAAAAAGAPVVELHTGAWAEVQGEAARRELERLRTAAAHAAALGLRVNAGHGLTTANVGPIAALPQIAELNIGHALISRALYVGIGAAVREMKAAMAAGRAGERV